MSNFAICQRTRDNLRRLRDQHQNLINQLSQHEERVANLEGEIQAAESVLQRSVDRIEAIGTSAVGCAAKRNPKDCLELLVSLSNDKARHESRMRRLRDALFREQAKRDRARSQSVGVESDIQRTSDAMTTHQCW